MFGKDWKIKDFTKKYGDYHDFRELNIISISNNEAELILYFHESKFHSNEIAFYGFNKGVIEKLIDYIKTNPERKIYFYLYLMLDTGEAILNFALPIFLIKNNEKDVSINEESQSYLLHIIHKKSKYYLRLKNNQNEDLFGFMKNVNQIFEKKLIDRYNKEQQKFFEKKHAQEELLKKLKI